MKEEVLTDSVTGEKAKVMFLSHNCECQLIEPYGFVPEDGCTEHDIKEFSQFVQYLENRGCKKCNRRINSIIAEFGDNPAQCLGILDEELNGGKETIY